MPDRQRRGPDPAALRRDCPSRRPQPRHIGPRDAIGDTVGVLYNNACDFPRNLYAESPGKPDPVRLSLAVNGEGGPDRGSTSPARGLTGLIAANVSLIIAIMVYMGWGYENAFYGYFHLSPLDLGISIQDYLFYSLHLFNPSIVFAAVVVIAAAAATRGAPLASAAIGKIGRLAKHWLAAPWLSSLDLGLLHYIANHLSQARDWLKVRDLWQWRVLGGTAGALTTVSALALYLVAGHVPVNAYLLLGLLACGPLLLTWTLRGNRQGRALYALAIVVSAVCALWAGSLYANDLGTRAAQAFGASLGTKPKVAVYSTAQLALSGPGVTSQKLPPGYTYRYRYEGLRLLYMSSGTYYLLPSRWTPQSGLTYVIDQGEQMQMRIELY